MAYFKIRLTLVMAAIILFFGVFGIIFRYELVKKLAKEEKLRAEYLSYNQEMDTYRKQRIAEITKLKEASSSEMNSARQAYEDLLASQSEVISQHTKSIPQTYVVEVGGGKTTYVTSASPKSSKSAASKTIASTTKTAAPASSPSTSVSTPKPTATATTKTS